MKHFILVVIVILCCCFCSKGVNPVRLIGVNDTLQGIKVSKRLKPKPSALVLIDSVLLQKELGSYLPLISFSEKDFERSISFVWMGHFILEKGRLYMQYEAVHNQFDSLAISFMTYHFLNYTIESNDKKKRKVNGRINVSMIYETKNKSLIFEISDTYKQSFYRKRLLLP